MPCITTMGRFPHDSISVKAIMLWPGEAKLRRFYSSSAFLAGHVRDLDPSEDYWTNAGMIQDLLDGPSWSEIREQSAACTRRAFVAGHVLTFMFLMDRLKERLPTRGAKGASLSKAIFLSQEWARQGNTYGDGSAMFASEKSVKDCWRDYRAVAHLWAAVVMNGVSEFAPPREVMLPAHFDKFMRAAAYLQMFGMTHTVDNKAKRTRELLLDPASTWLIDVEKYQPAIMLVDDPSAFDDAPFMVMLKKYQA